jgi:hypothetical protein
VLAPSAQDALDDCCQLPEMATPATVASVIQRILMSESLYTLRRFLQGLMKVDARGSGHVQHEEVKWYIKLLQLPLREQHTDPLLSALDKRNTGKELWQVDCSVGSGCCVILRMLRQEKEYTCALYYQLISVCLARCSAALRPVSGN